MDGSGELEELLRFSGTSYTIYNGRYGKEVQHIRDFRVTEDGTVEMLWSPDEGGESYVESLRLEEIRRIPVTVCGIMLSEWIKRQIHRFNQESDTYYIVVEEYGIPENMSETEYDTAVEDFVTLVGVRTAAGKGPDIFVGAKILGGDVDGMVERGVLEDLRPYMERSGILTDEYFPMTFNCWRSGEGIYGILAEPEVYVYDGEEAVFFPQGEMDMASLVKSMSQYKERAIYMKGMGSLELLRHFLEGSENLWGMVDWNAGTCDFETGIFRELLEISGRYGDSSQSGYHILAKKKYCTDFYAVENPSEMEERGRILCGLGISSIFVGGGGPVGRVGFSREAGHI